MAGGSNDQLQETEMRTMESQRTIMDSYSSESSAKSKYGENVKVPWINVLPVFDMLNELSWFILSTLWKGHFHSTLSNSEFYLIGDTKGYCVKIVWLEKPINKPINKWTSFCNYLSEHELSPFLHKTDIVICILANYFLAFACCKFFIIQNTLN